MHLVITSALPERALCSLSTLATSNLCDWPRSDCLCQRTVNSTWLEAFHHSWYLTCCEVILATRISRFVVLILDSLWDTSSRAVES